MKKLLGAIFAMVMVVAATFGLAACDTTNSNDAETAQKAVTSLKLLYDQSKFYETSKAFEVLGEVAVDGTNYPVAWTVTSESGNVENYITFGEMDADTKKITASVTLPETAIEYKLNAKVTVNKESAEYSFNRLLVAKAPDAAGTAEDPYVPSKVMEIASTLGESGSYYYSEADKGGATPTRVWVEGYIVDCGNGDYFGSSAVGWVYIADSYDAEKTYDSTNSLCIYRIEYDETNLTSFDDLVLGKKIRVNGFIEWYQGKNDSEPYAELASFKNSDNTYSSVYCDYLEKDVKTDAEQIDLALSKVSDTMTVAVAGDKTLPESSVKDVTFEWSTTDATYTVSNNTLHVATLPADADKEIKLSVKATCGTDEDTKEVTVNILKAVSVEANQEYYTFAELTGYGTGLNATSALSVIKAACGANSKLVSATPTNVYDGNGQGGAHPNTKGLLKFGKSGAAGTLVLTFSETVSKIVFSCHDWYAPSSTNPTNSNTISVNGVSKLLPYNADGKGDIEIVLDTPATELTIEVNERGFVFNFMVTYGQDERSPKDKVAAAKAAVEGLLTTKDFNALGTHTLPASSNGANFSWAVITDTDLVTITDNGLTLNIVKLPESKTDITLTVTITCDTASDTQTVTISVSPAPAEGEEVTEVYSFSGLTGNGTKLTEVTALETIKGACNVTSKLVSATPTNVYDGAGSGGAHANATGLLKLGSSKENGTLVLTFSAEVTKIVINCHDFYTPSDTYPTNSNQISVNGSAAKLLPYNATGKGTDMEFVLTEPSTTVTIAITNTGTQGGRAYIFNFTVTLIGTGSEGPTPPTHTCQHVCEVCGKCTDPSCQDPACANKCPGHESVEVNYGTEQKPLSVTEALALAETECTKNGDYTKEQVYMVGIVKAAPTPSGSYYKNLYLLDENNPETEVLVFSINLSSGVAAPEQNDKLVIHGYITRYKYGDTTGAASDGVIEFSGQGSVYVYALSNTRGLSTITLGEHDGATVTGLPQEKTANGTEVTFTVEPVSGKKIESVKINGNKITATEGTTYKFTVAGDMTVTVDTKDEGAADEVVVATFTFGENGDASHSDGSEAATYTETDGNYSLSITGGTCLYNKARDAQGNSCLKLGTGKKACTFTFTVPADVTKVVIYVAGYKKNSAAITINGGAAQTITSQSDSGEYTQVEVDTSEVKTITVATTSAGYRAMIDKIEFYAVPAAAAANLEAPVAILPNEENY